MRLQRHFGSPTLLALARARDALLGKNNRTIEFTSPFHQQDAQYHSLPGRHLGSSSESYLEDYKTVQFANESSLELNDTAEPSSTRTLHPVPRVVVTTLLLDVEASHYQLDRYDPCPALPQHCCPTSVDLNSILFACEQKLSAFYKMSGSGLQPNTTRANFWAQQIRLVRRLCWMSSGTLAKKFFYDINTTSGDRAPFFILLDSSLCGHRSCPGVVNETISLDQRRQNLQGVFSGLRYIIDRFNGTFLLR